jgi:small subunit ribosomal protein S3
MGRKVHPMGFRLGVIKDWQSRWYADRGYADLVLEDSRIRKMVSQKLTGAGLASVEIQRSANQIEVTLHTAKPGVVIGKGGQAVDEMRKSLEAMTGKKAKINIEEIKQPELNAYLVAESIAEQLSRRISYRRALKQSIMRSRRAGAKGVRIRISGRLGGAEMARSVWDMEGRVPLHTLRADIDYGIVHAHTTYGRIGVKVWIYKGDVIERKGGDALLQMDRPAAMAQPRPDRGRERGPDRGDRGGDRGPDRGPRGDRPRPQGAGGAAGGRERSDERGGRARSQGATTPAPQRVASETSGDIGGPGTAGVQNQADSPTMPTTPEMTDNGGTE